MFSLISADDRNSINNSAGGGRDSPKPTQSDGWITTGKSGKPVAIDQNKLRSMAKVMFHIYEKLYIYPPMSSFGDGAHPKHFVIPAPFCTQLLWTFGIARSEPLI